MRRALIVESNVDSAEVMGELIAHLGLDVRVAHSEGEALVIVADFSPEVALIEIGLTHEGGYELIEKLKALPWSAECEFVSVTALGGEDVVQRSIAAGFSRQLTKPVSLESFRGLFV